MYSIIDIGVIETPVLVKDSSDESLKVVPEFDIKVTTDQYTIFIVRYVPDLHCFNQLVKMHYQKIKIPFPRLTDISKAEKRLSIRSLFQKSLNSKTNAEKVEKYLHRCSVNPILKTSSLLQDFFSPQRETDFKSLQRQQHAISTRSSLFPVVHDANNDDDDDDDDDTNGENINESVSSLSLSMGQGSLAEYRSIHENGENLSAHSNQKRSTSVHDVLWHNSISTSNPELSNPTPSLAESKKSNHFQNECFIDRPECPLDNLEMIKVLGRGCMGKVLLVKSKKTMRYYALKSIVKDHVVEQREIKHTIDEQDILSSLSHINHPFIAKLHASFQDEFRLYLVTDYYCGGDLATHMARLYSFPKHCALVYAAEIIEGIGELHRLGILYRDLKPENILIDGDGHIVLTDFGLSKWLTESNGFCTQTFCGTAEYLAPEVLLGEEYSFGVDHWSFGTILYEMLTGVPPFWAENHPEMYRRIMQDSLEFPNNIADYETTEFLTFVLDKDPITRLGANGTQEIKSHAFFADIDWVALRHRHIEPLYIPASSDFLDFSNFDPDFLSMDPTLTPAPSEINLILELQDIFEDYCFTDETYADEEYSIADIDQLPVVSKSSLEKNPEILQDIDSTLVSRPSLKRGSFSMLSYENELYTESSQNNSNNESNINTSNSPKSLFNDSVQKEETSRHAKRRNTSILENHFSLIEDTLNKKMTDTDNCTKAKKEKICDESSLGSFEFSNLPDLRFAFSLNNASSQSTRNTIKTVKRSKSTRRNKIRNFFSFVL